MNHPNPSSPIRSKSDPPFASEERISASPWPSSGQALLTDLYQLTMSEVYYARRHEDSAVFELFVRRLPENRNYLICAGLDPILDYLEGFAFSADEIDWIRQCGHFGDDFAHRLSDLRFTGDVHAMPEGTPFFENEPVIRITAPLPEAQLVESRLINLFHIQTLIASKAARIVNRAEGKTLVDFGFRRAHGAEAGVLAARASYIAGFDGSATVEAGKRSGIPLYGTMAHSFIQIYPREIDAFLDFARVRPDRITLLVDTYEIEAGVIEAADAARALRERGVMVTAIRIDSGDLESAARTARRILDDRGCKDVKIFLSGSLDEYVIDSLLDKHCPVDGFGVGTRLNVSQDAPSIDCVYKLQEYAGRPSRKRSPNKTTLPGRKQVWRRFDDRGEITMDIVGLESDPIEGEALLEPVMRKGRRLAPPTPLDKIRRRGLDGYRTLPERLLALHESHRIPVEVAPSIHELMRTIDDEHPPSNPSKNRKRQPVGDDGNDAGDAPRRAVG
ncbi:nicotinate phosphoribosyltransferase [Thioalkalivibrio sp. HK1]|uniref:nicotinate phosphoribosyltransferase n=1 Tax=Thioalkalivibrio sp. HK1 TaxID=1469245 RepID=UPI00046F5CB6|nr:nicotinate phosphoribosyltransferase [Thioalkalivibrio sp. HK1]